MGGPPTRCLERVLGTLDLSQVQIIPSLPPAMEFSRERKEEAGLAPKKKVCGNGILGATGEVVLWAAAWGWGGRPPWLCCYRGLAACSGTRGPVERPSVARCPLPDVAGPSWLAFCATLVSSEGRNHGKHLTGK